MKDSHQDFDGFKEEGAETGAPQETIIAGPIQLGQTLIMADEQVALFQRSLTNIFPALPDEDRAVVSKKISTLPSHEQDEEVGKMIVSELKNPHIVPAVIGKYFLDTTVRQDEPIQMTLSDFIADLTLSSDDNKRTFHVVSKAGKGGMGHVYQVMNELGETFAMKQISHLRVKHHFVPNEKQVPSWALDAHDSDDKILLRRLVDEIRAANLMHKKYPTMVPQIIAAGIRHVTRTGNDNRQSVHHEPVFLQEMIWGETIGDVLERKKRLSVRETADRALAISNTLLAAHESGLIHRDVKPSNLMFGVANRSMVLMDWGLVRHMQDDPEAPMDESARTRAHQAIGTPHYMSPEQVEGRAVTPATDVHSFAKVICHMLMGQTMYPDVPNALAILRKIQNHEIPPSFVQKLDIALTQYEDLGGKHLFNVLMACLQAETFEQPRPTIRDVGAALIPLSSHAHHYLGENFHLKKSDTRTAYDEYIREVRSPELHGSLQHVPSAYYDAPEGIEIPYRLVARKNASEGTSRRNAVIAIGTTAVLGAAAALFALNKTANNSVDATPSANVTQGKAPEKFDPLNGDNAMFFYDNGVLRVFPAASAVRSVFYQPSHQPEKDEQEHRNTFIVREKYGLKIAQLNFRDHQKLMSFSAKNALTESVKEKGMLCTVIMDEKTGNSVMTFEVPESIKDNLGPVCIMVLDAKGNVIERYAYQDTFGKGIIIDSSQGSTADAIRHSQKMLAGKPKDAFAQNASLNKLIMDTAQKLPEKGPDDEIDSFVRRMSHMSNAQNKIATSVHPR